MWNYDIPNGQVTGDMAYKYAHRNDNYYYQGRNINRLYSFYNELMKVHMENFPNWRFGQLIDNFEHWMSVEKEIDDIFYFEEDTILRYINEFVEDRCK